MVMPHATKNPYDTMEDDTTNNEGDRGAVAQSVKHLSKVPVWCNSTNVGLNHAVA